MKKTLRTVFIFASLCFTVPTLKAQWCIPTTIIPYAPTMPGITHVVVGTIDRTSADLENYPNNSYVSTGLSTELEIGSTYSVLITHTIDASICPDMNLRVWVDYNLDYSLDDAGETVISVNHHAPGTYTGTFTIPATAVPGTTLMRITAKMSDLGGHTLPTPCDMPNPDPLGYHGETEDYTVNIVQSTGLPSLQVQPSLSVFPTIITDHATISFTSSEFATLKLTNTLGEIVWTQELNTPDSKIFIGAEVFESIRPGVYFFMAIGSTARVIKKILVQ